MTREFTVHSVRSQNGLMLGAYRQSLKKVEEAIRPFSETRLAGVANDPRDQHSLDALSFMDAVN